MARKPSKAVSSRQRTFDGRMPKGVWVRNHRLAGAFCVLAKIYIEIIMTILKHVCPKCGKEFCLSKEEANKLRNLDIKKMILMGSEERLGIFSKLIGVEKADWVNARFEKDLVLKNQKEGMLNWVKKTEMKDKYREEIIRKISKLEKTLSAKERDAFLTELAEIALDIRLTQEEVETIFNLSRKAEEAKENMENGGSKEDYAKAQNNIRDYVNTFKNSE